MQECLEAMAMPVIPWSPLADEPPPAQASGLILPGGFPELHAEALSHCRRSLSALQQWITQKPLYAECGGMLMLGESLSDAEGTHHPMAGVLPFRAERGALQVGYRSLRAADDGLLLRAGECLRGHEFHRWQLSKESGDFVGEVKPLWQVEGWKVSRRNEGWSLPSLHASWVHLHWAGSSTISCRWRAALETAATRNAAVS
jgi:cobyrinic acid a,c-diamide synthase